MARTRWWRVALAGALLAACGGGRPAGPAPRAETGEATASDGVPIAYEVHGQGPVALVFVHGWSCDRSYWRGQLAAFAGDYTVVALDLGGHGQSGLGRTAWTMPAFGDDVAAVVEKLGLRRVILVGHSMGGDVVVAAARRLRGRVAGLVLVDSFHKLGGTFTPEQIAKATAPFHADFVAATRRFVQTLFRPGSDPALVERVATAMSSAHPEVGIGAIESGFSFEPQVPGILRELKVPVVAINADYRPTDVASLASNGVQVTIMPGVGHFLMLEEPARFNELLRTALARIPN